MATQTAYLGMTLPAATEKADIAPINANFEILDSTLGNAGVGKSKKVAYADLDSVCAPGWYYMSESESPTIGGWKAGDWYIRVDAYGLGSSYCVQHLYPLSAHKIHLVRYRVNGTWEEPEWVNPLMVAGTEYRTTERYAQKAVYVKLIDFGALPNATGKLVSTGVSASRIIRHSARVNASNGNNMPLPYFLADGTMMIKHLFTSSSVQITTTSDYSTATAEFVIWYTKD